MFLNWYYEILLFSQDMNCDLKTKYTICEPISKCS